MKFRGPCLLCRLVPEPVGWGGFERGLQKSLQRVLSVHLPSALLLCPASTHQQCWFSLLQPGRNPGFSLIPLEAYGGDGDGDPPNAWTSLLSMDYLL